MAHALKQWLGLLRTTLVMAWRHDCLGQAKGAAFSTILFFFPLLLFLVSMLVASDMLTQVINPIVGFSPRVIPPETRSLILDYVEQTSRLDPTNLILVSFFAMLWTGWGLMSSFIEGVNRAFGLHEERSLLRNQVAAIKLLFLTALPVLAFASIAIASARIEGSFTAEMPIPATRLWRLLKWVAVGATMICVNATIYKIGVHRRQTLREVMPGALLATGIWITSSEIFRGYASHFGRYNLIYGSLGAAIILFVWMYLSSLAVLLGGEFNAVLAHERDRVREAAPVEAAPVEAAPAEPPPAD